MVGCVYSNFKWIFRTANLSLVRCQGRIHTLTLLALYCNPEFILKSSSSLSSSDLNCIPGGIKVCSIVCRETKFKVRTKQGVDNNQI